MSSDRKLREAVFSEPDWDPSVTAACSGVSAKAGVVTLAGHGETSAEKQAAEIAARRMRDVKAVAGATAHIAAAAISVENDLRIL